MRPDHEIQRDVEDELRWNPELDDTDIAVKANDGVVTLAGFARSYFQKYQAELAAKRVQGVAGIANDLTVHLAPADRLDDPQIARAAVAAIRSDLPSVADRITVLVHHGRITLEGTVEWCYQRDRAEATLRHLNGVMGVDNQLIVTPCAEPGDVRHLIEAAFKRNAEVDADRIQVQVEGSQVVLSGRVRTWSEWTEAQNTASSAPGVTKVRNEITVGA